MLDSCDDAERRRQQQPMTHYSFDKDQSCMTKASTTRAMAMVTMTRTMRETFDANCDLACFERDDP